MTRLLSTAICVALLAATAGAFALTEKAKLQLSPVYQTVVQPKVFSPDCNCRTDAAFIAFKIRHADTLSVWLERNGKRVRTLASHRYYPRGKVSLEFNGVSDGGLTLPDGTYQPVIHLARSHLTLHLPEPAWIHLDTKPPHVRIRHRVYTHISPGCACAHGIFRVPFRASKPSHGILYVDGKRVAFTNGLKLSGTLLWTGQANGVPVAPGNYVLSASAEDEAGNRSKPIPFAVVTVRYIQLGRTRILVKPGARFAVTVLTDAHGYDVLFNGRRVSARGHTLRIRAPKKSGVYRLYVEEAGHAAKAVVVVG